MQMWGRAVDEKVYKAVVAEWNATHANQIELTLITGDDVYLSRIAAAAAGGELPDLLDIDLVLMPDFINQGLLQPITAQVNGFANKANLSPGHMQASTTADGKIYGVPFYVDASSLFWNKDLFRRAGLDPEKGPASWAEMAADAKKIRALGGDIYGFYFAGACAGCNAYTLMPQIWAAGGDIIDYTTHSATMATDPVVRELYQFYADLWSSGVMPESVKAEGGNTWQSTFASGNIGITALGGGWGISGVAEANPDLDFGVTALPGKEPGQTSAFAGGDTIALTTGSKDAAAAWEFIEWTLSDEVQVQVFAKNGAFTSRTDLAANEYSNADPRRVANNEALKTGRTPSTLGYAAIFNDNNGPLGTSLSTAIFEGDVAGALLRGNEVVQGILDNNYK